MTESVCFSNSVSTNNSGDWLNGQWNIDPSWKYFTTDGHGGWIQQDPPAGPPTQWILPDPNLVTIGPIVGTLRQNGVTGMIEMWDGAHWLEYGRPINPPAPEERADDEDFELGGAL